MGGDGMAMEIVAEGLGFPEGPVARADGSVDLVEIETGCISRIGPDGSRTVLVNPGNGPNGLALGPDGAYYVCSSGGFVHKVSEGVNHTMSATPKDYSGGRIDRFDPATGSYETLYDRCGEHALRGPNDIVFDREGGFYFTDLGKARPRSRDLGGVYYARTDGKSISEIAFPMMTPNGIGLSPDENTLYVAETESCRVWAFDLEAPGRIRRHPYPSPHGGRIVCGLPGFQKFDSLAIDSEGNICVATIISGAISVISPDGRLIRQVPTGDLMTTNICFGGTDMRTAYISLSGSGRLARCRWPEPGLKLNFAS